MELSRLFFSNVAQTQWSDVHSERVSAIEQRANQKVRIERYDRETLKSCVDPDLPTIMSSLSAACGRRRVQMSMVNRVLLLLKMEAREDMRAASITASIRPRSPEQGETQRHRGRERESG